MSDKMEEASGKFCNGRRDLCGDERCPICSGNVKSCDLHFPNPVSVCPDCAKENRVLAANLSQQSCKHCGKVKSAHYGNNGEAYCTSKGGWGLAETRFEAGALAAHREPAKPQAEELRAILLKHQSWKHFPDDGHLECVCGETLCTEFRLRDSETYGAWADHVAALAYAASGRQGERQQLADWMIAHGFATGHGDTFADLLNSLEWQVTELRKARRLALEEAARTICAFCDAGMPFVNGKHKSADGMQNAHCYAHAIRALAAPGQS